jgi:hypothetical protein
LGSEHIETNIIIQYIEEYFLKSGKITMESEETKADFIFNGRINDMRTSIEDKGEVIYQVYLELIDLKNSRKVWIKTHQIKKSYKLHTVEW